MTLSPNLDENIDVNWNELIFENQFSIENPPSKGDLVIIDHKFAEPLHRYIILAVYTGNINDWGPEFIPLFSLKNTYGVVDGIPGQTLAKNHNSLPAPIYDFFMSWSQSKRNIADETSLRKLLSACLKYTYKAKLIEVIELMDRSKLFVNPESLELFRRIIDEIEDFKE